MIRKLNWISVFMGLAIVAGCGKQNPATPGIDSSSSKSKSTPTISSEHPAKSMDDSLKAAAQETIKAVDSSLAFTLKDQTGKEVRLSDFAGKIVVLEWLNPECPFVQAHYKAGTMVGLAKKYADKGVVWLGVNSTKTATAASNKVFVDDYSLPYPILDDHEGTVGRLFGAKTTPHLFVLDTKGQIAYQGAIDNSPMGKTESGVDKVNYVDQAVAELLKDSPVTVVKTDPYGCSVKY